VREANNKYTKDAVNTCTRRQSDAKTQNAR